MKAEPLFGDKPKTRRKGVWKGTMEALEAQLKEMPRSTYQATDDDLPLSFWPEPNFDEETPCSKPCSK